MTSRSEYETLFHRHPNNPILTAAMWPYPAHTVFIAGATRLQDGTTLLLVRVEDRTGHSHFTAARSKNGVDGWVIDSKPTLRPEPSRAVRYALLGAEPRGVRSHSEFVTDPRRFTARSGRQGLPGRTSRSGWRCRGGEDRQNCSVNRGRAPS